MSGNDLHRWGSRHISVDCAPRQWSVLMVWGEKHIDRNEIGASSTNLSTNSARVAARLGAHSAFRLGRSELLCFRGWRHSRLGGSEGIRGLEGI